MSWLPSILLLTVVAADLPEPEWHRDGRFATSLVCARCHSNTRGAKAMRDWNDVGISPYDMWRASAMANATRDPLWRAMVSAEIAATPSRRKEITAKCMRCHAPMASVHAGDTGTELTLASLTEKSSLGHLARDGVSCTVCHQIEPDNLGRPESFGGQFRIGKEHVIYGPHRDPFFPPMRMQSGYTPQHAEHILESSLCATCHTLWTDALDPEGREVGHRFLEQAPYLEWQNSVYSNEGESPSPDAATCQDCHVPIGDAEGTPFRTRIARNPGGRDFPPISPRTPFGLHTFVGGNTLLPALLRDHSAELRSPAPPEALEVALARTRWQLRHATATVELADLERREDTLAFRVVIRNLTGHKLPTGHPTRRMWLRVEVRDVEGKVLFASGKCDDRGRILGGTGRPLAAEQAGGPWLSHHDVIRRPDEAMVYEVIMGDPQDRITHVLLRAAKSLKDNRLLPRGWRADGPGAAATGSRGVVDDPSFVPGEDTVRFEIRLADPSQAVDVEATLLYQPLGSRFAAELLRVDTPEIKTFRRYYEAADVTPETLARARWLVQ